MKIAWIFFELWNKFINLKDIFNSSDNCDYYLLSQVGRWKLGLLNQY